MAQDRTAGWFRRRLHCRRLTAVPPRWRAPVAILWWLLAAVALTVVAGGAWRAVVYSEQVEPRFERIGVTDIELEDGRVGIAPMTPAAIESGLTDTSHVVAIDGRPVGAHIRVEELSHRIAGPNGPVRLTIAPPEGAPRTITLARNDAVARDAAGAVPRPIRFAVRSLMMLLAAAGLILSAALLMLRRRDDPVSILFATAFLFGAVALPVSDDFLVWAGFPNLGFGITAVFFLILTIVVPAFPDGRYAIGWSGWLPAAAVVSSVLVASEVAGTAVSATLAIGLAMIAASVPFLRYRRIAPGIERQQLKWAGFGFFSAFLALALAMLSVALVELTSLPQPVPAYIGLAAIALFNLAFFLLPAGLVVSVLRFRLWRADAAIGRSALVAMLTLSAGAIWAGSTQLLDNLVADSLGSEFTVLTAAASTIVAAGAIGPIGGRLSAWIDTRFRARLIALRALPDRLRIWQHADTPEEVGERIAAAIAAALAAERVAVLLWDGGYRPIGRDGIGDDAVARWIAVQASVPGPIADRVDPADPLFPVRIVLEDGDDPIGALLIGPRPDGSLYARDERSALAEIELPLAAALRQARRRTRERAMVETALDRLDTRLAAIEREYVPRITAA